MGPLQFDLATAVNHGITIVGALGGALVGAYVAFWLALKQLRAGRLFDRRLELQERLHEHVGLLERAANHLLSVVEWYELDDVDASRLDDLVSKTEEEVRAEANHVSALTQRVSLYGDEKFKDLSDRISVVGVCLSGELLYKRSDVPTRERLTNEARVSGWRSPRGSVC